MHHKFVLKLYIYSIGWYGCPRCCRNCWSRSWKKRCQRFLDRPFYNNYHLSYPSCWPSCSTYVLKWSLPLFNSKNLSLNNFERTRFDPDPNLIANQSRQKRNQRFFDRLIQSTLGRNHSISWSSCSTYDKNTILFFLLNSASLYLILFLELGLTLTQILLQISQGKRETRDFLTDLYNQLSGVVTPLVDQAVQRISILYSFLGISSGKTEPLDLFFHRITHTYSGHISFYWFYLYLNMGHALIYQ